MTGTTNWTEVAKSFASEIEAATEQAERDRRLPTALIDAWRDAGLYNLWVPKEYGGEEVDLATFQAVIETVSEVDGSAGWVLMIGSGGNVFGAYLPPQAAREVCGSNRAVVAGSVTPRKAAVPVEGGYRVTGRWPFASGCPEADWILAASLNPMAQSNPAEDRRPGPPDLVGLVMPASDCRIIDTWNSMGLRATSSHDFEVNDVFVPQERTFAGFHARPHVSGALYQGGLQNLLQIGLVGAYLGIARAAVDSVIELANVKTPTMRPSKLRESPVTHRQIGEAEAVLLSARAFAYDTAEKIQAALVRDGGLTPRLHALRQMTVAQVARSCAAAVDIAYEIGGTTGVYAGNKLERCFRDIHVATQHMGVSPNQFAMAGLRLLDEAQAANKG